MSIVAHICARSEGGSRFDPSLDDRAVNDDSNLIVLCGPHHKIVDDHPDKYPAEVLHEWKRERAALPLGDSLFREFLKILLPDELPDWSLEEGAPEFIVSRSTGGQEPERRYKAELEVIGADVKVFARFARTGRGELARLKNHSGSPRARKWHLSPVTLAAEDFPLELELRFHWHGAWRHQRWIFDNPASWGVAVEPETWTADE